MNPIFPPSNVYPPNNYTNANPFGVFKSQTTTAQQNNNQYNFNKSFQENSALIERQNWQNQNNTLHNNLGTNILSENINEYRISIDSKDRDVSYYNPFKYNVIFSPAGKQNIKEKDWIDPNNKSLGKMTKNILYDAPPMPHIKRSFKNIKFIRLENIILPKYNRIIKNTITNIYSIDTSSDISNDRYIILKIKEFTTSNMTSDTLLGTNNAIETGFVIVPDTVRSNSYSGLPYYTTRNYENGLLGNVNKLSFEFTDSDGNLLELEIIDQNGNMLNEKFDTLINNSNNLNNIYNTIYQNHMSFTFGVVENRLNTNTKYEQ